MKKLPLANEKNSKKALKRLEKFYRNGFIAPEKKPFFVHGSESIGPYLGVETDDGDGVGYILDAASQIATLGLGFSSGALKGAGQFLSSWTNDCFGPESRHLQKSFKSFLARKIGWDHISMMMCNSGAEANEVALGLCYAQREESTADKILAFEGSFHGRTLVSLASTWSPKKREPFAWPEAKVVFCSHPSLENNDIMQPIPSSWHQTWEEAPSKKFSVAQKGNDDLLNREIDTLVEIRKKLLSKDIFAIILEPMQSEGGDRYSSNRFHTGLMTMAKSFGVPVIYDEVQTGFHLGREFFWHRQFDLKDKDGVPLRPDFVVCAKKAQLGLVLSPREESRLKTDDLLQEGISFAGLAKGYIHGLVLDQFQEEIQNIEKTAISFLQDLTKKYPKFITRPRGMGLCFAFDVPSTKFIEQFVALRFEYSLLYYPAGDKTLRFRLNLSYGQEDLRFLFDQLKLLCDRIFLGKESPRLSLEVKTVQSDIRESYRKQGQLLKFKLDHLQGKKLSADRLIDGRIVKIDKNNFEHYRKSIIKLEEDVYEAARQTDIEYFQVASEHPEGVCLGIEIDGRLVGIAFAAPLKLFPLERGTRQDPYFDDEQTLYSMDITIHPDYAGKGLGQILKYAQVLSAQSQGAKRIQGRNRDRLARKMLKINLALGAYESAYLFEDYPDHKPFRDALYYTLPCTWERTPLDLSGRIQSPVGVSDLTGDHLDKLLPYLANKVCLSNFVSEDFLQCLKDICHPLPDSLKHIYSTSGQSECADKLGKSLWFHHKKSNRMMTFRGHFFGGGTFFSRSLSSCGEGFFPVDILPHPNLENIEEVLEQIKKSFSKKSYAGVWIEPVMQRDLQRVPKKFLLSLKELCYKQKIPLLYNETAAAGFAYEESAYFASSDPDLTPDGGFCFLGGQAGLVFCREGIWIPDKLMMISTWDGDEFSFFNYRLGMQKILKNKERYEKDLKDFERKLEKSLADYSIDSKSFFRGRGCFKGTISTTLAKHFHKRAGYYVVDPSWDSIKMFLEL